LRCLLPPIRLRILRDKQFEKFETYTKDDCYLVTLTQPGLRRTPSRVLPTLLRLLRIAWERMRDGRGSW